MAAMASFGSTNGLPKRYEGGMAEEKEDKEKEEKEPNGDGDETPATDKPAEDSDASEEAPPDEGAPPPDAQAGGEMPPDPNAPPPGHEEFLRHLDHAFQNHPVMHGMHQDYMASCQKYADEQAQAPPQNDPSALPGQAQEAPAGAAPGAPPEDAPPNPEGQAAQDQQAAEQAMSGGADEMPPPKGDEQAKPYSQAPAGLIGRPMKAGMGALGGGAAGLGVGMLTGHPLAGTAIGAGLGGAGGAMLQNNETPVSYAALQSVMGELNQVKTSIGKLTATVAAKDKELTRLSKKATEKEVDLMMYQFGQLGIKNTVDRSKKEYQDIRNHLLSLSEQEREAKASEIVAYWDRDESVAYEGRGAPVGEFLTIDDSPSEGGAKNSNRNLNEKQLGVALTRMRAKPKEHDGMTRDQVWEECKNYAMNGQVVTG